MKEKEFAEKIINLLEKRKNIVKEKEVYLKEEEYKVIEKILAPVFKLFYSPETGLKKRLNRLTEEQAVIKKILFNCQNKQFLIRGYAGTGKTYVAYALLSNLVKEGKNVLYLCYTKNLAIQIESTLRNDPLIPENLKKNFRVYNFHKLDQINENLQIIHPDKPEQKYWDYEYSNILENKLKSIFSLYPKFDAIFVDEGQNFKKNWWECVKKFLKKDAYFYIFYDPYQNIFDGEQEPIEDKLPFLEPVLTLKENLRNQKKIAEKVETFMNIQYKYLPEHPEGDEIKIIQYHNESDYINKLNGILRELVKKEKKEPQNIVLLSYKEEDLKLNYEITRRTLKGFIGLEADVLLIKIDDVLFKRDEFKNDLYMGMTRAIEKEYLFIHKEIYDKVCSILEGSRNL